MCSVIMAARINIIFHGSVCGDKVLSVKIADRPCLHLDFTLSCLRAQVAFVNICGEGY